MVNIIQCRILYITCKYFPVFCYGDDDDENHDRDDQNVTYHLYFYYGLVLQERAVTCPFYDILYRGE